MIGLALAQYLIRLEYIEMIVPRCTSVSCCTHIFFLSIFKAGVAQCQ